MSTQATPGSKKRDLIASPWHEICLSPTVSWTPAPGGVLLREADDEITPTSLASPAHFSFATPKSTKNFLFFSSNQTFKNPTSARQHGYLTAEAPRRALRRKNTALMVGFFMLVLVWGAWSWSSLQEKSSDPVVLVSSSNSPSGQAKSVFAALFDRDWGAEPSLWVVLEASTSKRVSLLKHQSSDAEDSHSFTDDTSKAYGEGKQFCNELTAYLEQEFQVDSTPSVRLTSYYSLQEQGLDYVARHMVTPDGSRTMVEIQFIQREIGAEGTQKLKREILGFAKQNKPSYLDIHFTGQSWDDTASSRFPYIGIILCVAGFMLKFAVGIRHSSLEWAHMTVASMIFNMSVSAIFLTHFADSHSTPMTVPTIETLSFVLSVYLSKLQVDNCDIDDTNEIRTMIVRGCGALLSLFTASFYCTSSPIISSFSGAASTVAASSLCFHMFIAPSLLGVSEYTRSKFAKMPDQKPTRRSAIALCVTTPFFLFLAFQAGRLEGSFMAPVQGHRLAEFGEILGHGRLTPYRLLFDGHKRNLTMTSLNG